MHTNFYEDCLAKWILTVLCVSLTMRSYALAIDTALEFRDDGAMTAEIAWAIPEKAAPLLREFFLLRSGGENGGPADETAVRRQFENADDAGVTLLSYNCYLQGDRSQRIVIRIQAEDARKAFQNHALGESMSLRPSPLIAGDMEFEVALPKEFRAWTPEMAEFAKNALELVGGFEMTIRLQTPTAVIETTGLRDAFNRCHWTFAPDDLQKSPLKAIRARW